ncbi:hypothetical protein [Stenotrophomonas sp.]|uniref:hypothetical protein n=1 Tax=Stenotrophomonas sp. TaxID=69392 RepID=UPI002D736F93|nr:hypothetical protein [Stenotrophomonas sp.]HYQ23717.1 hypothetical protein [Stenotrophomonas sp.]
MLGLYLFVRLALPLLLAALVAWLAARWINARLAAQPALKIPLPAHSLLDRAAAQHRYRRLRRRRPNLTHLQVSPHAPRSWLWATTAAIVATLVASVVLMPEGARFQQMVESVIGYPATVIEVTLPAGRHDALLQQWSPVLVQTARPISLRYRVGRTATPRETHAVMPVHVRRYGNHLQIATAQPVDGARLRAALQGLDARATEATVITQTRIAPWREAGWRAWAPHAAE